jgi:hypothetical protein
MLLNKQLIKRRFEMNSAQAKKIRLFDLLASLGHHPKETRRADNDVWYNSPFRQEATPSFKVKLDDNIWFDHGEGVGGNVIDFVIKYKNTDFRGALTFLESSKLTKQESSISFAPAAPSLFDKKREKYPEILEIKPVFSYALKNYIAERAISPDVAYMHLKEIRYQVDNKNFFALGFKNRAGGWELRSSIFKGVIGEKDISVVSSGKNRIHVFEGFMDFLSAVTMQGKEAINEAVILNSVALKRRGVEFLQTIDHQQILTYFDNDEAGAKALEQFRAELPGKTITPCNSLYAGYNDLNEALMKQKNSLQNNK